MITLENELKHRGFFVGTILIFGAVSLRSSHQTEQNSALSNVTIMRKNLVLSPSFTLGLLLNVLVMVQSLCAEPVLSSSLHMAKKHPSKIVVKSTFLLAKPSSGSREGLTYQNINFD